MYLHSILISSTESSLGRLDHDSLPHQALMEMVIEKFDDEAKEEIQNDNGEFLDACEWEEVDCDDEQRPCSATRAPSWGP